MLRERERERDRQTFGSTGKHFEIPCSSVPVATYLKMADGFGGAEGYHGGLGGKEVECRKKK